MAAMDLSLMLRWFTRVGCILVTFLQLIVYFEPRKEEDVMAAMLVAIRL